MLNLKILAWLLILAAAGNVNCGSSADKSTDCVTIPGAGEICTEYKLDFPKKVWSLDAEHVWAVGHASQHAAIFKREGTEWVVQDRSNDPSYRLNDLHGTAENNVWVVGDHGTIRHWDGVVWSNSTAGTSEDLLGVWASNATSAWAVGRKGTIIHWDGSTWTAQPSGTTMQLSGTWGADANNVWAVGQEGTILKWNGALWEPQVSGTTLTLGGVRGLSASAIWAYEQYDSPRYIGVRYWDGTSWSNWQAALSALTIYDIWPAGPGNIWAVWFNATPMVGQYRLPRCGIGKWDGSAWQFQQEDRTGSWCFNSITGILGSDLWVTGTMNLHDVSENIIGHQTLSP